MLQACWVWVQKLGPRPLPLGAGPHLHAPPTPQMLSFMHAQYSFFQQGYSLLHQLDPYMKKLAAEVSLRGGGPGASLSGEGVHVPLCALPHSWTSW